MDRAESIRQAMYEVCKARDLMWEVVLQELQKRDHAAAHEARAVARVMRVRPLVGSSTRAAALAWPYLDHQARSDWLWICQTMHTIWVRGAMEQTARPTQIAQDRAAYTQPPAIPLSLEPVR